MKATVFFFVCLLAVTHVRTQTIAKSFLTTGDKKVLTTKPVSDGGFLFLLSGDPAAGITSPVVVKTDHEFNTVWATKITTLGTTNTFIQLNNGNYLLYTSHTYCIFEAATGNVLNKASFTPSWMEGGYAYNNKCIQKPNGKIVFLNTGYEDFKIFQMDLSGNIDWAKTITSDDPISYGKCPGFDLDACDDSTIVVSGKSGNDNCFISFDDDGNVLWSRVIDFDDTYSRPYGMCKMDDGSLLVVGLRTAKGFVMKMSPVNGDVIWQKEVNDQIFYDAIAIGSNKYALVGLNSETATFGQELGISIIDETGNLVNSKQLPGITEGYTNPRLAEAAGKFYTCSWYTPLSGTGPGYMHLVEFEPALNFTCNSEPLTLTKIGFTLPLIDLGILSVTNTLVATTPITAPTPSVSVTVPFADYCDLFPPDVEIVPENPFATNGNDPIMNEGGMGTGVNEMDMAKTTVYPNPSVNGEPVTVSFGRTVNAQLTLTDLSGQIIMKNNCAASPYMLNTTNLAKGMYILQCKAPDGLLQTLKINIE
ncbi:MAG TPA: T9SS type A sorting domain-containing protein [Flavobacteriales bacterium]|nr:T9SS type A sorting domain-containing protein [Flavobacteriales bacterium]